MNVDDIALYGAQVHVVAPEVGRVMGTIVHLLQAGGIRAGHWIILIVILIVIIALGGVGWAVSQNPGLRDAVLARLGSAPQPAGCACPTPTIASRPA